MIGTQFVCEDTIALLAEKEGITNQEQELLDAMQTESPTADQQSLLND